MSKNKPIKISYSYESAPEKREASLKFMAETFKKHYEEKNNNKKQK